MTERDIEPIPDHIRRAVIPSIAAKASIAIGEWSRSLKNEVL